MFPIGDENVGTSIKPYVNWALIGLCVVVFLYELILPPRQLEAFFFQFGAIPAEVTQFQNLYTVLTSMFVHGGLAHIFGNMLFLYIFGDNIEDAMGHLPYLLFYLLCGFAAAATQILLSPNSTIPIIGASGAISGVMGAYIVLFPQGKVRTIVFFGFFGQVILVPAWVMIGIWFALQLFSGFTTLGAADTGGVAFWAHVGGFITGAILVWLFRDKDAVARQNAVRTQHEPWQRRSAGTGTRGRGRM
ncbi:MAG: rhomboid family intramembrane serine protease [Thermomicrobiales bacterium]|nr:rhomboid family intramembrane serine protease [Thermomicrobiales bacterium]